MGVKLHIGNLSQFARETDLENMFNNVGLVMSVAIPTDTGTGQHKSFGFVNMGTDAGAQAAISALNGALLCERQITVRVAGPKE
jgi:cold-inducible RNA-binding protein